MTTQHVPGDARRQAPEDIIEESIGEVFNLNWVKSGLTFEVYYESPSMTISPGTAYTTSGNEGYALETEKEVKLRLPGGERSYIHLARIGGALSFSVEGGPESQYDTSVYLGWVDTASNEYSEENRESELSPELASPDRVEAEDVEATRTTSETVSAGDVEATRTTSEMVSAEVLNNTAYVHASEGAAAVQSALDDAENDPDIERVYVYGGGEYEWDESIEVPNNTEYELSDRTTIAPPQDNNLTTFQKTVSGVTAEVRALVTNKDHESPENVVVKGGTYDFSNVAGTDVDTWIGIWLDEIGPDSKLEGVTINNLDTGDQRDPRNLGWVLSYATESRVIDCEANYCGYDGGRVMGASEGVEVIRSGGENNVGGTLQLTRWLPGTDGDEAFGQPTDTTFRECYGERIYAHGYAGLGGVTGTKFIDCEAVKIHLIGGIEDTEIIGGEIDMIKWFPNNSAETLSKLNVDNVSFNPQDTSDLLVRLDLGQDDCTAEKIFINNCDSDAGRLLQVEGTGSNTTVSGVQLTDNEIVFDASRLMATVSDNATVERVVARDNWVEGAFAVVSGGGINGLRVEDNTFVNVDNVLTGTYTDAETENNTQW